ncbi:MAG: hypothetical protein QM820_47695 [Minicystis sp.]
MIAEREEQVRQLVHHVLIRGGQVVELLQIDGGALLIAGDVAAQAGAALEELADERAVEDLFEGAGERGLDAGDGVDLAAEGLERVEGGVVDVGDERVAEPAEGLVDVVQIAVGDGGRAAEERAAGAAAVARSLAAGGERLGEHGAQGDAAAGLLVAEAGGAFERGDGVLLHAAAEGQLEEAAGAIGGAALGRDLRSARQGGEAIGGDAAAADLTLVEIDDVPRRLGERGEAGEERLDLARGHAGEAGFAVLHGLERIDAGGHLDLGLAHQLGGAGGARQLLGEDVVGHAEGVEIAQAGRDLLELLGELAIGAARARQLHGDAGRVLIAADLQEAHERGPERLVAARARGRLVPGHELRRDDALPPEPITQRHVRVAAGLIAGIRELLQRGQRLVPALQLVGEDLGEADGHPRGFFLVALDLDERRHQRRDAGEVTDLLGELLQAGDGVEVLGIGRVDDLERADAALRIVERALVELGQALRQLDLLLALGERDLALQRLGDALVVALLLVDLGNGREREAALGIEILEDAFVALQRAVEILELLGEHARLAQRDGHLLLGRRGLLAEAAEEVDRLLVIAALDGVVDELAEGVGIVAVGEHEDEALAGALAIAEGALQLGRGLARGDAAGSVGELLRARQEEAHEIGLAALLAVLLLEGLREGVARGIRSRKPAPAWRWRWRRRRP